MVITLTTIVWATGIKFDSNTGNFRKTAVIAINNSLTDVTVSLDGQTVGQSTPITLDGLTSGNYHLTISKAGFHDYERFFRLQPGDAAVVKDAELIAEQPLQVAVAGAVYTPSDNFDVGLVFQSGELLNFGSLVSRFATPVLQAHRFNSAYLYQQGGDLHLFFADSNQDFTVYHSSSNDVLKLTLSPSDWSVIVFEETPQQVFLEKPSN